MTLPGGITFPDIGAIETSVLYIASLYEAIALGLVPHPSIPALPAVPTLPPVSVPATPDVVSIALAYAAFAVYEVYAVELLAGPYITSVGVEIVNIENLAYTELGVAEAGVAAEEIILLAEEASLYSQAIYLANYNVAFYQAFATAAAYGGLATATATVNNLYNQYYPVVTATIAGAETTATNAAYGGEATVLATVSSTENTATTAAYNAQYVTLPYYQTVAASTAAGLLYTATQYENTVLAAEASAKTTYVDPNVATALALEVSTAATATTVANNAVLAANYAVTSTELTVTTAVTNYQTQANTQLAAVQTLVASEQATYVTPQVNAALAAAAAAQVTANAAVTTYQNAVSAALADPAGTAATQQAAATALANATLATAVLAVNTAEASALATEAATYATYVAPQVLTIMTTANGLIATASAAAAGALVTANNTVTSTQTMVTYYQSVANAESTAVQAAITAAQATYVTPNETAALLLMSQLQTQVTNQVAALTLTATNTANYYQTAVTDAVAAAPGTVSQQETAAGAEVGALTVQAMQQLATVQIAAAMLQASAQAQVAQYFTPYDTHLAYPYSTNQFTVVGTGDVLAVADGDTGYLQGNVAGTQGVYSTVSASPYSTPSSVVVQAKSNAYNTVNPAAVPPYIVLVFQQLLPGNIGTTNTFVNIPNDGFYHVVSVPVTTTTAVGPTNCSLQLNSFYNPNMGGTINISACYLEQFIPVSPPPQFPGIAALSGGSTCTVTPAGVVTTPSGQASLSAGGTLACVTPVVFPQSTATAITVACTGTLTASAVLGGGFFVYSGPEAISGLAVFNVGGYNAPLVGSGLRVVGNASLVLAPPVVTGAPRANLTASGTLSATGTSTSNPAGTLAIVGTATLYATAQSILSVVSYGTFALVGSASETVTGVQVTNAVFGSEAIKAVGTLSASGISLGAAGTEGPVLIVDVPDVVSTGAIITVRLQAKDASGTRLVFVGPPSVRIYNFDAGGNEKDLVPYTATTQQGSSYIFVWQVSGLGPYIVQGSGTTTQLGNVLGVETVLVQASSPTTSTVTSQGGLLA